jgi:hypothetical protein
VSHDSACLTFFQLTNLHLIRKPLTLMAPSGQGKRKDAPTQGTQGRNFKRNKIHDARAIRTQTADAAFSNGELNVDKFVKAREFEIKALEDGIKRSRHGLSTRAHQDVPRELRRRTASHNVKRVPKRLRERAKKEVCLHPVYPNIGNSFFETVIRARLSRMDF